MGESGVKESVEKRISPERRTASGVLAEFETPADLLYAAERVRAAGYRRWDAHTPFPIHGLDQAMGIRDTALGWIVLGGGICGCLFGVWMQWWMNAVDYPFVISGKPLWSLPANIPIIFELTILFSALSAFFGMLVLNGLPRHHHWAFTENRFSRVTSDCYFVSIDAGDSKFDVEESPALLKAIGGIGIEIIWDSEQEDKSEEANNGD